MRPFTIIALLLLAIYPAQSFSQRNAGNSANEILQKVVDKINSYETISYTYYRRINYFSENYQAETSGTSFLDFKLGNPTLGFRYQLEDKQYKLVYNGTESFTLNKKDSTIAINHKPNLASFASLSFFLNSVITLKKALPAIIADPDVLKTLADTTINQKNYHVVSLVLQNKTINGLGGFTPTTIKRNFLYKIVVDKESFLPHAVIQTNDAVPKDYMLTSFTEFGLIDKIPTELSWYYSTYTTDFKPASETKPILIKQNTVAPDWQSEYFNSKDSITLSKLKGHVILLEFWTKNCGYCIAAVPKLNTLVKKYKDNKFQVIGINRYDDNDNMNSFYQRNQPNFKTVHDSNGKITSAYGVEDFPKVVLIDKKGMVLYSGNFDQEQLEKLLKIALR